MAQQELIDQLGNKELKARYADKAETANTATEATSASNAKSGSTLETQLNQKEVAANKKQSVDPTSETDYVSSKALAEFVNSSVSLAAADYISDHGEPFTSVQALNDYAGTVTNNDYAFVTGTDQDGNTYFDRYKATVSGSTVIWAKEFRLNNSSFTAAQWNAITSGITAVLVASYNAHLANNDIHVTTQNKSYWNAKYDKPSGGIPSSDMTQAVQDALSSGASALQPTGDGKEVTSTVTEQNNYTNPGSNATTLTIIFGKIWNFIGRLVTAWQNTPDDTHFPSEKLVKSSIDNLANTMSSDYCTKNTAQRYANYVAGPGITITGSGLDPKTVSSNLSEVPLVQKTLGVKIIENSNDTASIVTAPDMLLYATNSPFMQSTNGAMYFNVTSGTFETHIPEADSTLEVTNEDVRGFDATILYKCYMKVKVENTSASDVTITMSVPSFGTNDTSVQHLANSNTTTTMDVIWYSKGRTSFTGTISGLVSGVSAGIVEIHAVEVRYA